MYLIYTNRDYYLQIIASEASGTYVPNYASCTYVPNVNNNLYIHNYINQFDKTSM